MLKYIKPHSLNNWCYGWHLLILFSLNILKSSGFSVSTPAHHSSISLISRKKIDRMPLNVLYIAVHRSRFLFDVPISWSSGRNVLFRCCFRFFPTFKAKHGAKREFSVTRLFLLFWRFLFSYFTLLLSTCCLRMIRCWKILLPFFWWVSSSLPLFRHFKKCQNPSFLLCLAFDFFRREFLSGFSDIALCDIIKKSELWFIEWNMQRFSSTPHRSPSRVAGNFLAPGIENLRISIKAKWKKMGNK